MAVMNYAVYLPNVTGLAAKTHHAGDAAILTGAWGDGAVIKYGGRIVWREGREVTTASESFDHCANIILDRVDQHHRERLRKLGYQLDAAGHIIPNADQSAVEQGGAGLNR